MNERPDVRLLLDEMFSPAIASELRERDHNVIAVADRPDLRPKSDEEIFAWASTERRWLLTENVKDFRPIMLRALPGGPPGCGPWTARPVCGACLAGWDARRAG
jgi:predicted nuclease of predicted toxin-antitoxin system